VGGSRRRGRRGLGRRGRDDDLDWDDEDDEEEEEEDEEDWELRIPESVALETSFDRDAPARGRTSRVRAGLWGRRYQLEQAGALGSPNRSIL
jgi:hypothetical protein